MTSTPVGMRCPECARQRTKIRTARTMSRDPQVTYVLIAINVIVFLGELAGGGGLGGSGVFASSVYQRGALVGTLVADGEWWRIVTSGFLHAGFIHILFNMYFLYFMGNLLEPVIGRLRFAIVYVVSLLGGSFGALLLTDPNVPTVGASGAVFGLLAAGILAARSRGISPMQSGLGLTLALNLGITFLLPGISIGGHLGGLIAGGVVGLLIFEVSERHRSARGPVLAACAAVGVIAAVGAVVVARSAAGL